MTHNLKLVWHQNPQQVIQAASIHPEPLTSNWQLHIMSSHHDKIINWITSICWQQDYLPLHEPIFPTHNQNCGLASTTNTPGINCLGTNSLLHVTCIQCIHRATYMALHRHFFQHHPCTPQILLRKGGEARTSEGKGGEAHTSEGKGFHARE